MLLADGGTRAAETVGLKVDDVDLNDGVVIVLGKDRRPRGVPIGHQAIASLGRYLRARSKRKDAHRPELWLGPLGPLTDSGVRQILIRRSDQAGVPRLHPHALRHFFADSWLRAGGNESDLMRITGRKSRQMVDRYAAAPRSITRPRSAPATIPRRPAMSDLHEAYVYLSTIPELRTILRRAAASDHRW